MKKLYKEFMATPLAQTGQLSREDMFHVGCTALRDEIMRFIDDNLESENESALGQFSMGQNDGLRWVKDHLEFLWEND